MNQYPKSNYQMELLFWSYSNQSTKVFESEFRTVPSLQCVMILGAKILTPSTTSISEGFYCSKNWSIFTSSEQTLQNDINFVEVSIIDRRKLRPPKHHVTFCAI